MLHSTDARRGSAAIELVLVLPLLLILLSGTVEIGLAAMQAIRAQSAAEAGGIYAAANGVTNLAAIQTAVLSATSAAGVTAPSPVVYCGCPSASGIAAQGSDCSTVCADGKVPGKYVTVTAVVPHTTVLPYLNLPLPAQFTGTAVVRVQ